MKPLGECRLYTFVDTAYLRGRSPVDVARALCEGGSDLIQLRAKDLSEKEIERIALDLLPVTRAAGVRLMINDQLAVAHALGADGCHLGQEDFFDAGHRRTADLRPLGRPFVMGLSTHSPAQAERSLAAGPDYLAIGPIYPTGTKPTARPVTLEYVRWAASHLTLPWFAIGGVNLETLGPVLEAGARRICVVSAILNADDIAETCQAFKNRLISAPL